MSKSWGLGLVALVVSFAATEGRGESITPNLAANADIVAGLAAAQQQQLRFGRILPSASSGTVSVSNTGARTSTGGVTLVAGGGQQFGRMRITGTAGSNITISYPASVTLSDGGSGSMTLDGFTAAGSPTSGTLDAGTGQFDIDVGGTLAVSANQAVGTYTGNVQLTVAYQ
jgi:hypothetical protein